LGDALATRLGRLNHNAVLGVQSELVMDVPAEAEEEEVAAVAAK
jgi:hypothetical protein